MERISRLASGASSYRAGTAFLLPFFHDFGNTLVDHLTTLRCLNAWLQKFFQSMQGFFLCCAKAGPCSFPVQFRLGAKPL
jgi:hypothetical protein